MSIIVKPNIIELITNPDYLNGKAWHMDVDNDEQGMEAQKWLFRAGFTWPNGEKDLEPNRANLQSIWLDNVEEKTFTGGVSNEPSHRWDVNASLRVCEGEGFEELYVFEFNDIIENTPDTHDMFNQLYESTLLTEEYQPKLVLDFDPPIYRDQFQRVTDVLLLKYPELRWHSGRLLTGDEIYDRNDIEYIGNLTIGWDSDYPDRLTYDESNVESGFINNYSDDIITDGWEWVKSNETDYDITSNLFDQLNEQEESDVLNTIIYFDPILQKGNLDDVFLLDHILNSVYKTGATFALGRRYNPFLETNSISYIRIDEKNRISFGSTKKYTENTILFNLNDYNIIDGREFLSIDTHGMFDQLNEQEDELSWVDETVSNLPINIGDVFYIVDNSPDNQLPDDYKPRDVRYVVTVVDIVPNNYDIYRSTIKYKPCSPEDVTYNPKDYSLESPLCYDYDDPDEDDVDENGYEKVEMKWFLNNLLKNGYWRPMGSSL